MDFDFDRIINRQNTSSIKWDFRSEHGTVRRWDATESRHGNNRVLPMWVADMDFGCPETVVEALVERAAHGIYGYTGKPDSYTEAVIGWMEARHHWPVDPSSILTTPGVVPTINMALRCLIKPGDGVLIQPPVYHPFYWGIDDNGGRVVTNPLCFEDGVYRMDFDDLERKAADPKTTFAILCSPHNPVGRVWDPDELTRFADICLRNDVFVIADEIHGDLILPGNRFTAYGTLGAVHVNRAIICTSGSKTFNLAGLHCSNIMVKDEAVRTAISNTIRANGLFGMNPFSLVATETAYRTGGPWLDAMLAYVAANIARVTSVVNRRIPEIDVIQPQGTYLLWLDCRRLGLAADALEDLILNKACLYFDEGVIFGPGGAGYERVNLACPRTIVDEALDRLAIAVADLRNRST